MKERELCVEVYGIIITHEYYITFKVKMKINCTYFITMYIYVFHVYMIIEIHTTIL